MTKPTLYSIPAGAPFVDVLATGIRALTKNDPHALARVTVLLPTRRACRALSDAFLRQSTGQALLLPRLRPLGDLDEDELALSQPLDENLANDMPGSLSLPPAISGIRRRLLLARLVMAISGNDITADQASWLAAELGKLLDQTHTEQISFAKLADLVPGQFAEHWQITLSFLELLTKEWPKILEDEGCIDPADRRNRLLASQAELWRNEPPQDWIIAAGSTGTIPATADLLSVVAHLPNGMVILPGFDLALSDDIIAALEPTHPQFAMTQLLQRLGIDAASVPLWPHSDFNDTAAPRSTLLHEALKPAKLTGPRFDPSAVSADALEQLTRINCSTPQEEASVIALAMRETLETPGKTAALITPDRSLARRVATALKRWDIDIDDSAGVPLAQTPAGAFLRLSARMAAEGMAPVALLAALKHPLAGGGRMPSEFRQDVRLLERSILHGPRPAVGLAGLQDALSSTKTNLDPLLECLETETRPFIDALADKTIALRDIVIRHVAMAEALAATDNQTGAERLWAGEAGETAAGFIAELADAADALGVIDGATYPALFDALLSGAVVRPRFGKNPRLFIWGLMEARLQSANLMILGGLNEGTWPPESRANPWMSRPMLSDFGLPLPERRIGLTAHDFAQAFCTPNIILTRAERVDGAPSMPARWLLRLENVIDAAGLTEKLTQQSSWLPWSQALDTPVQVTPLKPPKPTPPVDVRPREMSVSRVETWIRDPYSIYARNILNLKPIAPLEEDPGARDRGIIIHDILDRFIQTYQDALPDNPFDELIVIGQKIFEPFAPWPNIKAFWWPRFEIIAAWFIDHEIKRRAAGYAVLAAETTGQFSLEGPAGSFTVTARADRIDGTPTGGLAILDYKTGQPPTEKQAESGLAPQLPLEAVIAEQDGFKIGSDKAVEELTFVQLSGGRNPAKVIPFKNDIQELMAKTYTGLQTRITAFDRAETPYLSRPTPMFINRAGDYDHLARVKEWSSGSGDDS